MMVVLPYDSATGRICATGGSVAAAPTAIAAMATKSRGARTGRAKLAINSPEPLTATRLRHSKTVPPVCIIEASLVFANRRPVVAATWITAKPAKEAFFFEKKNQKTFAFKALRRH
jgi:hypothetical protein